MPVLCYMRDARGSMPVLMLHYAHAHAPWCSCSIMLTIVLHAHARGAVAYEEAITRDWKSGFVFFCRHDSFQVFSAPITLIR